MEGQGDEALAAAECETEPAQARSGRINWARLLKRVVDIDRQQCPNCGGGELRIIAALLERPVVEKIFSHLGLDPKSPPKSRAREVGQDTATPEPRRPSQTHHYRLYRQTAAGAALRAVLA